MNKRLVIALAAILGGVVAFVHAVIRTNRNSSSDDDNFPYGSI